MKQLFTKFYFCVLSLLFITNTFAGNELKYPQGFTPKTNSGISFTENKGQVHDQNYKRREDVLFGGTDGNLVFHLKNNGISYQLNRVDSWKNEENAMSHKAKGEVTKKVPDQSTIYRLDINWVNANTKAEIIKGNALEGYSNYYLESCPNGALNVNSFEEVTYEKIYPGIDLKWYQKDGHLKYDYIVAAGADYKQIQLEIRGAQKICLNKKGELILKTPLGDIIEQAPLVKQNGKILKSKWLIKNNILSFDIENLNKNEEFIIDPIVRVWGTYYGGVNGEYGFSCATDVTGNVYLTGMVGPSTGTIIATVGSHQSIMGSGTDAFLVKFNSSGIRLWGTYYGGAGNERGYSCSTDINGNVFLAGETTSFGGTSIATPGSHQPIISNTYDAFLVKFNSGGVRQWGTYYGDNGQETGYSCSTDPSGNVYLSGISALGTGTAIVTAGCHQFTYGGNQDAFLVKFNSSGVRQWSTYYGGAGYEDETQCCTDNVGNIFLSGRAGSNTGTVIATVGSHQSVIGGGSYDAYLVKFNSNGIRQWGTYYGGVGYDYGSSCATDGSGNVYLSGHTPSNTGTIIATVGSHQPSFSGGTNDAFLVKLNPAGIRQWATYYGGLGDEILTRCMTDISNNVYLSGCSNSTINISTLGSYQQFLGGILDGFVVKFNSSGVRQWGSYYGGPQIEYSRSSSVDAAGNVYLAGDTESNLGNSIATLSGHQSVFGGGQNDAFLVQLFECNTPSSPTNTTLAVNQNICINNTTTLLATGSGTISWFASPTSTTALGTGTTFITPTLSTGTYTYYAEALTCTVSASRTAITITVNALPTINATSSNTLMCVGETVTLTANGASTYTWNPGGAGINVTVSPMVNTTYTVTGTDLNGCSNTAVITQSVDLCTRIVRIFNSDNELKIYPNPVANKINVVSNKRESVQIFNAIGALIYNAAIDAGKTEIDLTQQPFGIYFIKVGSVVKKIIKE